MPRETIFKFLLVTQILLEDLVIMLVLRIWRQQQQAPIMHVLPVGDMLLLPALHHICFQYQSYRYLVHFL